MYHVLRTQTNSILQKQILMDFLNIDANFNFFPFILKPGFYINFPSTDLEQHDFEKVKRLLQLLEMLTKSPIRNLHFQKTDLIQHPFLIISLIRFPFLNNMM